MYKTIVSYGPYQTGIYDGCYAEIQMRHDGNRYRVIRPGVKWVGNTGGYHEDIVYLTPEKARKIIRAYRSIVIHNARGDWINTPMDAIDIAVDGFMR